MEIPLHLVPEKLFNPLLWAFFEVRFQSRQDALDAISEDPSTISPLILGATSTASSIDRWQEGAPPYEMRRILVDDLQRQLRNNDLIATGVRLSDASGRRRRIKPTDPLWLDFGGDAAHGVLGGYTQIKISKNKKDALQALKQSCIAFVKSHPNLPNKVMRYELEKHLGRSVSEPLFRFALKEGLNRKPGRPRSKI